MFRHHSQEPPHIQAMTKISSPGPIARLDDELATLYLGHLAAQAEIALPGIKPDARIALTWLAAHIASQKVRLWTAHLADISIAGEQIGTWRIRARTSQIIPEIITLERRKTLQEDGRQIATLAHSFMANTDDLEQALDSIADFSSMMLASVAHPDRLNIQIVDLNGLEIQINVSKAGNFQKLFNILFVRFPIVNRLFVT